MDVLALKPRRLHLILVCFAITALVAQAAAQTEPIEGIRENTPQVHALVNARIIAAPGQLLEKGALIVRDGTIEAIGTNVTIPPDALIWDYTGMTIYPGLIELYSQLGLGDEKQGGQRQAATPRVRQDEGQGQPANERKGAEHWNPYVRAETKGMDEFRPKSEDLKKLRDLGFTVATITPDKGIFSGSSAVVSLREGSANDQLLRDEVAQNIMFKQQGGFRNRTYPNSLMGMIALVRQTWLDADWYDKAQAAYALQPSRQTRPEANATLAALALAVKGTQPVLLKVEDERNFLRAARVAKEFGLDARVLGSGHEYRYLDAVKGSGMPVILPLNYPKTPEVESPEKALDVSLADLTHWEAAPNNPRWLHEAGLEIAFTTAELKKPADFHRNVRTAIERGLPADAALAALTTTPAKLLGLEQRLGSLETAKLAHMVVTEGELFTKEGKIRDVWVDGFRYEVNPKPEGDPRGKWLATLAPAGKEPLALDLEIKGEIKKLNGSISRDERSTKLKGLSLDHKRLTLTFSGDSLGLEGVIRMSARVEKDRLSGRGELADGTTFSWTGSVSGAIEDKKRKQQEVAKESTSATPAFARGAYSFAKPPSQPKHVLVHGGTIWTAGPQGNLENADMLVTDGKIAQIGPGLQAPEGAITIDAKDKHVSPGLIDAHSHSGLDAVNEGSQAVTSEVRTVDVVDDNDIALYRELAGGLTTANQLHGSANPIGGQNSVIKLRWGSLPEDMVIADAPQGIKFALGENVKRSRLSNNNRYPDTRMGVEQIIRDRFKAAQDYDREWRTYNALKNKKGIIPPRRDLELEALVEILNGDRLVHSHSYRQDEILMLVRIADDFGFQIATFQHVLEGYKVAEALAAHGAGASTFSDWWAYKFEVIDAIPYNGAIMHDQGVVVSFNSDSEELARRMNLEASKAVKYGGVPEEEALKFVTFNAAKQLRIDHRVGSLEVGKDADFVIWSGSPLSTYSHCEQTWVDGRKYFDIEEDRRRQHAVLAERARLIQKVLTSKDQDKKPGGESEQRGRPTIASPDVANPNQELD